MRRRARPAPQPRIILNTRVVKFRHGRISGQRTTRIFWTNRNRWPREAFVRRLRYHSFAIRGELQLAILAKRTSMRRPAMQFFRTFQRPRVWLICLQRRAKLVMKRFRTFGTMRPSVRTCEWRVFVAIARDPRICCRDAWVINKCGWNVRFVRNWWCQGLAWLGIHKKCD